MKTCLSCGKPLIDLPYTEVFCAGCKEAIEKFRENKETKHD